MSAAIAAVLLVVAAVFGQFLAIGGAACFEETGDKFYGRMAVAAAIASVVCAFAAGALL